MTLRARLVRVAAIALAMVGAGDASWGQASPSAFTTGYRYDAQHRLTGTISPDPDGSGPRGFLATRNTYDDVGRLTRTEEGELAAWQSDSVAPAAWTGFTVVKVTDTTYDTMSRQAKVAIGGPTGTPFTITQMSYDLVGRLDCTTVRMNPATFAGTLPTACTATPGSTGVPPDRITRNFYDAASRLVQVKQALGTTDQASYATYSYTPNSKRQDVIDAVGNRARLLYDGFDRLDRWQFPSTTKPTAFNPADQTTALSSAGAVNTGDYELYGYDKNDNRTSMRKRDGRSFTYAYDALNRMQSKIVPDGGCSGGYVCYAPPASATRDVYYAYDLRGLQLSARFDSTSGTDLVANGWDGFGRQTSSTTAMSSTSRALAATFDGDGNRLTLAWPDSVTFGYGYDGLDRMQTIAEPGPATAVTLSYDNNGRRSNLARVGSATATDWFAPGWLRSLTNMLASGGYNSTTRFYNGATLTPGYNPAGQITRREATNPNYDYAGYAPASTAYQADGLNRYATVGGTTYAYDSNGNLTGDGAETYRYDAENRLLGTVSGSIALIYDSLGRLYETGGTASATRRFLYDGDALVAEYDTGGTLTARYVHGAGVDEPLLWYDGAAVSATARRQLFADHQGSIAAVADGSGVEFAINRYDDWGVPGASNVGRFQYTGQILLASGAGQPLYHYKARVYAPRLGRFLQTDPVGYDDQVNLYAYVANDPVNGRDPDGKQSIVQNAQRTKEAISVLIERVRSDPVGAVLDVVTVGAVIVDIVNTPVSPGPDVSIPAAAARTALRTEARAAERGTATADRTASSPLRRDAHGIPRPDPEAAGRPHTQLGVKEGERVGPYRQTREFDASGRPVRDRDFTDHGRSDHTNPHQHIYTPNATGGSPNRGPAKPFD